MPIADPDVDTDVDEMFDAYRATGDRSLRNDLVVAHLEIARRCARRYQRRGEPHADLEQVARLALVQAVERFDPGRGVRFESFAMPTVIGKLRHHFRDHCWAVSVPRSAKDLRSRVHAATEQLSQALGRQPTLEETSEAVGVCASDVATTLDSNRCYRAAPLEPNGDESDVAAVRPAAGDDPAAEDAADRLLASSLIGELDDRTKRIIVWRFYEECTQREIGDRLGIGQVQVSRLLTKALEQMRRLANEAHPSAALTA